MKVAIYLWGASHYLYDNVFYSLDDAVDSANTIIGTNIKKEELLESTDSMPQRWIPGNHEARQLWNIRFYRREVDLSQAKEDVID